jgi:4-oxalocrotonate tautomerase
MPLARISLRQGKSVAYRRAIMDQIYEALRETFDVPEGDRFMILTEHDAESFIFDRHYLGVERSDDLVIIQITVSNTRGIDQKKRLYKRLVQRLADRPGLRPEDVFINLIEVAKENWSFGNGEAQYT